MWSNKKLGLKSLFSPLLLLFLLFSVLLNLYLYRQKEVLAGQNRVVTIIDGDTLVLQTGQRLRLANLSAPELMFCGGSEAKDYLSRLVFGKTVTFQVLSQEVFNRSLAYVYVGGQLVNELVLKEGWARYDGTPSPQRERLKAAYDEALNNRRGIFSPLCRSEKPEKEDCLIKGNVGRNTGIKRYHFPGCSEYERAVIEKDLGDSWFCSEEEAQAAGFAKSPNCFGKNFPHRPTNP